MDPAGPFDADEQAAEAAWVKMPMTLLGRCLRRMSRRSKHAAFATCKAFARAMLKSTTVSLGVQASVLPPGLMQVFSWAAEPGTGLRLRLLARQAALPASLGPLLRLLHQEGVVLPGVTHVSCEGLLLDAAPPAGAAAVFPDLQELHLYGCHITAGLPLPLAGCSRLQALLLRDGTSYGPTLAAAASQSAAWLAQLGQLAGLTSLTSLTLDVHHFPTSFLTEASWVGRVTELHLLDGFGDPRHVTSERRERWRAALGHAAHLRHLRKLGLGACTVRELATLLERLPQLQSLQLADCFTRGSEADGFISTALQTPPRLTQLSFAHLGDPLQSFANSPCTWEELTLLKCSPRLIRKLPLHALTQPLRIHSLIMDDGTTVAELREAVGNLAHSHAPMVMSTAGNGADGAFAICFGEVYNDPRATPPATLLQQAGPLVARDIIALTIKYCQVDAALVLALQQVAPPSLATLSFEGCVMQPSFWPQLARSFPQLEQLAVVYAVGNCKAEDVLSYFQAFCEQPAQQPQHPAQGGATSTGQHLRGVRTCPPRPAHVEISIAWHKEAQEYVPTLEAVNDQLQGLGLGTAAQVKVQVE